MSSDKKESNNDESIPELLIVMRGVQASGKNSVAALIAKEFGGIVFDQDTYAEHGNQALGMMVKAIRTSGARVVVVARCHAGPRELDWIRPFFQSRIMAVDFREAQLRRIEGKSRSNVTWQPVDDRHGAYRKECLQRCVDRNAKTGTSDEEKDNTLKDCNNNKLSTIIKKTANRWRPVPRLPIVRIPFFDDKGQPNTLGALGKEAIAGLRDMLKISYDPAVINRSAYEGLFVGRETVNKTFGKYVDAEKLTNAGFSLVPFPHITVSLGPVDLPRFARKEVAKVVGVVSTPKIIYLQVDDGSTHKHITLAVRGVPPDYARFVEKRVLKMGSGSGDEAKDGDDEPITVTELDPPVKLDMVYGIEPRQFRCDHLDKLRALRSDRGPLVKASRSFSGGFVVITCKVMGFGPDDRTYKRYPELQTWLPRGMSFAFSLDGKHVSTLVGVPKFFGTSSIDDDDVIDSGRSVDGEGVKVSPTVSFKLRDGHSLFYTEKENGKFFLCTFFRHNDQLFMLGGSKNKHYVIPANPSDESWLGTVEGPAKASMQLFSRIIAKLPSSQRDKLVEFCCKGATLIGEYNDWQHVVPGAGRDPSIVLFGASRSPKSFLATLEFLDECGMATVTRHELKPVESEDDANEEEEGMHVIDLKKLLFTERLEGGVIVELDASGEVVRRLKYKTLWYVMHRVVRQKAINAKSSKWRNPASWKRVHQTLHDRRKAFLPLEEKEMDDVIAEYELEDFYGHLITEQLDVGIDDASIGYGNAWWKWLQEKSDSLKK